MFYLHETWAGMYQVKTDDGVLIFETSSHTKALRFLAALAGQMAASS